VNWRAGDRKYSSLGPDHNGLAEHNSAYIKPRAKRRAFLGSEEGWLTYGNLLALPNRLVIALCDAGYLLRGEVIWRKGNPMPEGRCRRPHRQHESIFLLARNDDHEFRVAPPVGSVWDFPNEKIDGPAHFSRFPEELPRRSIEAFGRVGPGIVVFDPFSGSGTTGIAALKLNCAFIGFEIDPEQVAAANKRLRELMIGTETPETKSGPPGISRCLPVLQSVADGSVRREARKRVVGRPDSEHPESAAPASAAPREP
jgi:hypothetical protein